MNLENLIGKVEGINGRKESFEFELKLKHVKHIRRCLKRYNHTHPLDENKLQENLINSFMLFGLAQRESEQPALLSIRADGSSIFSTLSSRPIKVLTTGRTKPSSGVIPKVLFIPSLEFNSKVGSSYFLKGLA